MKLLCYEHCPYVGMARCIFGIKNVPVEIQFMLHNDEKTLIDLVGSKQCPVLIKDDGTAMKESIDIIKYVDANFGGPAIMGEDSESRREDIAQWMNKITETRLLYKLLLPRFVNSAKDIPELSTKEACDYFVAKKQDPAWGVGDFTVAYANSQQLLTEMNALMEELIPMVKGNTSVNGNSDDKHVSYEDLIFFSRLRLLTIVKGLVWPDNVKAYLNNMIEKTKLYSLEKYAN